MQSELLTKFYRNYHVWLEAGAPDGQPFRRNQGLCSNLVYTNGEADFNLYKELKKEIRNQFLVAGLDTTTPFNDFDEPYHMENRNNSCHKNSRRIQWVKGHLVTGDNK